MNAGFVQTISKLTLQSLLLNLLKIVFEILYLISFLTPLHFNETSYPLSSTYHLREPEGRRSIFSFSLFLIEKNVSYQDLFSDWKNIVPNLSYRILKSRKYIYNYIACANLIRDFAKINLKSFSSCSFWDGVLILGCYVLRINTQLFIDQIFDSGLRSENMEFIIFEDVLAGWTF